MTLSIITINKNNLKGLKKTAESVISQTWSDFEWIIIDGGSTDGGKEYIEQLAAEPAINISYWCSELDKGVYPAMNKGITHASGEWLLFLNGGDWLCDSSVLDSVYRECHDCDVLFGDVINVIDGVPCPHQYPDQISAYFLSCNFLNHQSTFFKRALFNNHQYDESLRVYSDWALDLQLLFEGKKFMHIPLYISFFMMDGISSKISQSLMLEKKKVYNAFIPSYIKSDFELIDSYYRLLCWHNDIKNHWSTRKLLGLIGCLQQVIKYLEERRK